MKHLSRYAIGFAAVMLANVGLAAAAVTAPPLPRGSEKAKILLGQNPQEMKRDKNAHKRPKKDKSLDDTRPATTMPPAAATATVK